MPSNPLDPWFVANWILIPLIAIATGLVAAAGQWFINLFKRPKTTKHDDFDDVQNLFRD